MPGPKYNYRQKVPLKKIQSCRKMAAAAYKPQGVQTIFFFIFTVHL